MSVEILSPKLQTGEKKSVLFVSIGNTCRSPMAAAIFRHLLKLQGLSNNWTVDSAGHGYFHVGDTMDPRAVKVLVCHGVKNTTHTVRQLEQSDYNKFDYMFGMDYGDVSGLEMKAPKNCTAHIALIRSYDPHGDEEIEDPYYHPHGDKVIEDPYYIGNSSIFEKCYQQCYRSCNAFLASFS